MKKKHWIKIIIGNIDEATFIRILFELFSKDNSSYDSVYVDTNYYKFDGSDYLKQVPDTDKFFIAMKTDDFDSDERKVLATIRQSEISKQLVVIINGLENNSDEWDKVKNITISLLSTIKDLKGKIISVEIDDLTPTERLSIEELLEKKIEPQNFISQSSPKPWEDVKNLDDKDVAILKLWNETDDSVLEISRKVKLSYGTTENRITKLRNDCGPEIVPYSNNRPNKKIMLDDIK